MTTTTYAVSGMHCSHCAEAVTEEIGKLAGVTGVGIDIVAGGDSRVTVTSEAELAESDVRVAIDEAGYMLTGVR